MYVFGLIIGLVFGITCAVAFYYLLSNRKKHYDERQLIFQGKGYKYGYTVMLLSMFLVAFLEHILQILKFDLFHFVDPLALFCFIAFVGLAVFSVYCIIKEAYFRVGEKSTKYIVITIILYLLNCIATFDYIFNEQLFKNKITLSRGASLAMSITFLPICIALIVKRIQTSKDNSIDDEDTL